MKGWWMQSYVRTQRLQSPWVLKAPASLEATIKLLPMKRALLRASGEELEVSSTRSESRGGCGGVKKSSPLTDRNFQSRMRNGLMKTRRYTGWAFGLAGGRWVICICLSGRKDSLAS